MARTIRKAKQSMDSSGASKRQKVESPLKPGDKVIFHSLKVNVSLNGKSGKLVRYDSDTKSWEVKTEFDVCIAGHHDKMVVATSENLKRKDQKIAAADRDPNMSCPTHVYVLMLEEWHHGWRGGWVEDAQVIGVYISKEAAALASGDINTSYGTFNEAIDPNRGDFSDEFHHEDNRSNPPDDGILIQLGGKDVGEGDYVRLTIQKNLLL